MNRPSCRLILALTIGVSASLAERRALAGVAYSDPAGGWRYSYDGTLSPSVDGLPTGYGHADDTSGLDGKWEHGQSDKWDGSGIGNPQHGTPGDAPGGVSALTDGTAQYIRIQDAGNPEIHGWPQGATDPQNSNRRVYFGHNLLQDFSEASPLPDQRVLNNGITISFRARIANTGPLDDLYTTDANAAPAVQPWIDSQINPHGRGSFLTNGRGFFNVVQNVPFPDGDDTDNLIGFSLVTSADIADYSARGGTGSITTGSGSGGLVMNNLAGGSPSSAIDSTQGGTLNLLEIPDAGLNEWREFWITIQGNGGAPGTHEVKVYLDGSLASTTFNVTSAANNNAAYANNNAPFLEFGFSDTDLWGAYDVDFFSYQLGVIAPQAAVVATADFDADGDVDGADFLSWQRGFGKTTGALRSDGDADGNGAVNAADLAIWRSTFGNAGANAALAAVPEPSNLRLAVIAGIMVEVIELARLKTTRPKLAASNQ